MLAIFNKLGENWENENNCCFFTFLDTVTTLKQGQLTMYVFLGLVIIHYHATLGVDRFTSV